jgi:Ran GTPase-activating protein (RanGAP) involved in mRNA processing and transport
MLPRFFGYINRQEKLNLSSNRIGDRQAKQIGEELASNTLKRLDVSDNRISDGGVVAITSALLTNQSLKFLNLGFNSIGDVGMTAVAQALTQNNSLKELCLSGNEIRLVALQSLADALKINTGLTTLWLNLCSIDDQGAEMLADALKSNRTLATLYLFGNKIRDKGAQEMLDVLTGYNTTLTCLDLYHGTGRISTTVLAAIKNMIAANKAGTRGDVHPIVRGAPRPPIQSDSTIASLEHRPLPEIKLESLPSAPASVGPPPPTAPIQAKPANSIEEPVFYIRDQVELYLDERLIDTEQARQIAKELTTNTTLKHLSLRWNEIGDGGAIAIATALRTNKSLVELGLGSNGIGDNGAAAIAIALQINKSLRLLHLANNGIGDKGAVAIAGALQRNKSLRELGLCRNKIGDAGMTAIAQALTQNNSLKELNLYGNENIGTTGLRSLADALEVNSGMKKIWLANCSTDDEGTAILADGLKINTTLRTVHMYSNRIGDLGATAMLDVLTKHNTTLTELTLHNSAGDISESIICAIGEILDANKAGTRSGVLPIVSGDLRPPGQSTIKSLQHHLPPVPAKPPQQVEESVRCIHDETTLNLIGSKIGAKEAKQIAKELALNTTLKRLYLYDNCIGDDGAIAIANALRTNSSLERLGLSWNEISVDGVVAIANVLPTNKSLKKLDLGYNGSGDAGMTAIAQALKRNNSLMALYLQGNEIGSVALTSLADALKLNEGLKTLWLSHCSINDEGATILVDVLKINTTLTAVYLDHNSIGEVGAQAILDAMIERNTTLTQLSLRGNIEISPTLRSAIENMLVANKAGTRSVVASIIDGAPSSPIQSASTIKSLLYAGLTTLWLSFCSIGNQGALMLAEALNVNSAVATLYLRYSEIGEVGAQAMLDALKVYKTTVKKLRLWGRGNDEISPTIRSSISNILNANKAGTRSGFTSIIDGAPSSPIQSDLTIESLRQHLPTPDEEIGENRRAVEPAATIGDAVAAGRDGSRSVETCLVLASARQVGSVHEKTVLDLAKQETGAGHVKEIAVALVPPRQVRYIHEAKPYLDSKKTGPEQSKQIGKELSTNTLQHHSPPQTQSELPTPKVAPNENQNAATATHVPPPPVIELPTTSCLSDELEGQSIPGTPTQSDSTIAFLEHHPQPSTTPKLVSSVPTTTASSVTPLGMQLALFDRPSDDYEGPADLPKQRVELEFEIQRLTGVRVACLATTDRSQWQQGIAAENAIRQIQIEISSGRYPTSKELQIQVDGLVTDIQETAARDSLAAAMPLRDRLEQLQADLAREQEAEERVRQAYDKGAETDLVRVGRRSVLAALRSTDPSDEIGPVPIDYLASITSNWTEAIGSGGFGVVFKGQDAVSGVVVAVKKIPNDRLREEDKKLFKNEIAVRWQMVRIYTNVNFSHLWNFFLVRFCLGFATRILCES